MKYKYEQNINILDYKMNYLTNGNRIYYDSNSVTAGKFSSKLNKTNTEDSDDAPNKTK